MRPGWPKWPSPITKFISDVQHLPRSDHSVGPHSDASVSEDVGLTFQFKAPNFKIEWSWIIGHHRFMKRHDGFDLQRQIKDQTQNTSSSEFPAKFTSFPYIVRSIGLYFSWMISVVPAESARVCCQSSLEISLDPEAFRNVRTANCANQEFQVNTRNGYEFSFSNFQY